MVTVTVQKRKIKCMQQFVYKIIAHIFLKKIQKNKKVWIGPKCDEKYLSDISVKIYKKSC